MESKPPVLSLYHAPATDGTTTIKIVCDHCRSDAAEDWQALRPCQKCGSVDFVEIRVKP